MYMHICVYECTDILLDIYLIVLQYDILNIKKKYGQ